MVTACDVLAVGAHPDDVELGCGATLARLAVGAPAGGDRRPHRGGDGDPRHPGAPLTGGGRGGRRARGGVAHLPRPPRRRADRGDAGQVRGGRPPCCAPRRRGRCCCPTRATRTPTTPRRRHWCCGRRSSPGWRAGRPDAGAPHRPRLLLAYPGPRQLLAARPRRRRHGELRRRSGRRSPRTPRSSRPRRVPATHLTRGYYLAAVEGRDRAAGNTAGCELGEGFTALGPLPADELAWLLARGDA